jgi:hypothetical protein
LVIPAVSDCMKTPQGKQARVRGIQPQFGAAGSAIVLQRK